jgi:DNA-binding IscR family transcriptional regulator
VLKRPEMAGALDGYRLAKQAADIEIWRRAE